MNKSEVVLLCGLPGAGKSTYAKKLSKEKNAIILSSDDLRVELYGDVNHQENNAELFQELYRRARNYLDSGQNVIIDATNISQKRRRNFINDFKKFHKSCIYLATPYKKCLSNDMAREKQVGEQVIKRMYKQLQIPFVEEGWDWVGYHFSEETVTSQTEDIGKLISIKVPYEKFKYIFIHYPVFRPILELPHDSTYHTLSVSRHTYHVWEYILDNYDLDNHEGQDKLQMLWAALLHDVGKGICKEFRDGKRYASYIGHENVSAQKTMIFLWQLGYGIDFIIEVTKLVQNHMKLLNDPNGKSERKLFNMYGDDFIRKLVFLREADKQAH